MNFLTRKITRKKSDALVGKYATNQKVLEIGARGKPSYTHFFPNRVGIDVQEGSGVDIQASVYDLPFKDGEFETVLCVSVLEHLEEPQKAINEIYRVLKPGGRIIVSVPFLFPIHDAPGDYWRFTKYGLRYLFRYGWNIEKLVAETSTEEAFAVLLQRFGFQTYLRLNKISKGFIFLLAQIIVRMPSLVKVVFGDIYKKEKVPEAFTSGFFLVARRI